MSSDVLLLILTLQAQTLLTEEHPHLNYTFHCQPLKQP